MIVLMAAGLIGTVTTNAAESDFGVAGNEEVLWVYGQVSGTHAAGPVLRFAYRERSSSDFRTPVGVHSVVGVVERLAATGDELHVLYRDGSHWRCGPLGKQVAAALPDRTLPRAWTTVDHTKEIWAVAPWRSALHLDESQRITSAPANTQPTTQQNEESETEKAAARKTLGERPIVAGLVRYEQGQWTNVNGSLIPEWFDNATETWLAADRETIHLLYRPSPQTEIMHARWQDGTWREPIGTGVQQEIPDNGAFVVNERLLFVFFQPDDSNDETVQLHLMQYSDSTWRPGPVLGAADSPDTFVKEQVRLSRFGQSIVTAEPTGPRGRHIKIRLWKPSNGQNSPSEVQIAKLEAPTPPVVGEDMAQWLLMATVVLLFAAAMRRRRMHRSGSEE